VQLLRHDAQLLAVDRRPQRAVRQADAGDAEGGQSAAEDQPLPGLHAGRDDRYQGRRAVPVRRPGQQLDSSETSRGGGFFGFSF